MVANKAGTPWLRGHPDREQYLRWLVYSHVGDGWHGHGAPWILVLEKASDKVLIADFELDEFVALKLYRRPPTVDVEAMD